MATPSVIVGYLAIFFFVGIAFVFVNLLVGKFLRPANPSPEKGEIYECGEPTIGSSFVQFDLRFYVVALLFIIFDVEVAFFFPWAGVYGKATQLAHTQDAIVATAESGAPQLTDTARGLMKELGVPNPSLAAGATKATEAKAAIQQSAKYLVWASIVDIAVFFAVLMLGFAYVWKRGDLDWVRAVSRERNVETRGPPTETEIEEPVLSA